MKVQCLLGLATLGLATILGLATRNSGFFDDQYINSTLGLATYIGFSDLNGVDENWSLNPAGTVLPCLILIKHRRKIIKGLFNSVQTFGSSRCRPVRDFYLRD